MSRSRELRARARAALTGRYWWAFAATLIVTTVIGVVTNILVAGSATTVLMRIMANPNIFTDTAQVLWDAIGEIIHMTISVSVMTTIVTVLLANPLNVSLSRYFIVNTQEKPALGELLYGFKTKYGRNVGTLLLVAIKTYLWSLLFVIPGIVKAYEYSIVPYLLADNPYMTSSEAFAQAKDMMRGNKWRMFKLQFSFIGWIFLSGFTGGLGVYFLQPYMQASTAEFYIELKASKADAVEAQELPAE